MNTEEKIKFLTRVAMIAAPALIEQSYKVLQEKYAVEKFKPLEWAAEKAYLFAEYMWEMEQSKKEIQVIDCTYCGLKNIRADRICPKCGKEN